MLYLFPGFSTHENHLQSTTVEAINPFRANFGGKNRAAQNFFLSLWIDNTPGMGVVGASSSKSRSSRLGQMIWPFFWTQETLTLRSLPNIDQHFAGKTVRVVMTNTPIFFLKCHEVKADWNGTGMCKLSTCHRKQHDKKMSCENSQKEDSDKKERKKTLIWRLRTDPIQLPQLKKDGEEKTKIPDPSPASTFIIPKQCYPTPGFH